MIIFRIFLVGLFAVYLIACERSTSSDLPSIVEISNPTGAGSHVPYLTQATDQASLQMSWLEPSDNGTRLAWSSFDGETWSTPELILESEQFFDNWADFPSLAAGQNGPIAAHWLHKVEGSTYAYHVHMAMRSDSGEWTKPFSLHSDQSPTEHGFVSLVPLNDGAVFAMWLDGHRTAHGEGMTLRSATIQRDARVVNEQEIDGLVCDCCQTGMARSGDSIIAVYRDRSKGEVRDIFRSIYDLNENSWGEPIAVSNDGWEIHGCPVNGPQVAAHGETVIVTWFSAANDQPRSFMAVSTDGGKSFTARMALDVGRSDGRVGISFNEQGAALLTWIEAGEDLASLMARSWQLGILSQPFEVSSIDPARGTGFARSAAIGDQFLVAWNGLLPEPAVRTVLVTLSQD